MWAGCAGSTRYRVLSIFFDGVPAPVEEPVAEPGTAPGGTASGAPARLGRVVHEPYANKECGACHDPGAGNSLTAPNGELCLQCHDLDLGKRYVHGPLASTGGCLVCHDPHSSPYRALLVSESDGFCLDCHDRSALGPADGHAGERTNCTACHEAHMSDRRYLLR